MVFTSPSWVPQLRSDVPDSISINEFMNEEAGGRTPFGELEKVVGVFTFNTIDSMAVSYAVHDLGGIICPANAVFSAQELAFQLQSSGTMALFTCIPLLETAREAAKAAGIPENRIYILQLSSHSSAHGTTPCKTVDDLIVEGSMLRPIEPLKFSKGQGERQTAYLCYSSGTSGLPKGVMISHRNVISNVLQMATYESVARRGKGPGGKPLIDTVLGLLPQSHIYGLVMSYVTVYRGDETILLPKFDFQSLLQAIQDFRISRLCLVPPIIVLMIKSQKLCSKYDLSSVVTVITGAAPLGRETAESFQRCYPSWKILQGYGLTETSAAVTITAEHDVWFGSSGSIFPEFRVRLLTPEGADITDYDQEGEVVVQSSSVMMGYRNNDAANKETFLPDTDGRGRWMRTGDVGMMSKAPSGNEHLIITERVKELIKVKGMQVAPAELEAHLLDHPSIADVAVIGIPDDSAGEAPKAYVVKSSSLGPDEDDESLARAIEKYVQKDKAHYKWLRGGVEFVDVIPKSPSGKILRRVLRDKEKEMRLRRRAREANL